MQPKIFFDYSYSQDNPEKNGDPDDVPLYQGANISTSQSYIAIMAYALRHSLSKTALQDLLKLINIHLPESNLPDTIYTFSKNFGNCSNDINFHIYCKECTSYLGLEDEHTCSLCKIDVTKQEAIKDGNYFVCMSLTGQLKDLMERPSLSQNFLNKDDSPKEYVSLLWNTDGMPAFQSGTGSVWPIQCMVKDLPIQIQAKNILLVGLWYGKTKPIFSTFLNPFIAECKKLYHHGVEWTVPTQHVNATTKVAASACACDSVARCQLQGIKQFNVFLVVHGVFMKGRE